MHQRKTLNITIGELDLEAEAGGRTARGPDSPNEPSASDLGMEYEAITPDVARELELPRNQGGAVVTSVERNSPAAIGGVRPGDVIIEVNRAAVTSMPQVTRELQRVPAGTPVTMRVWRAGQQVFVIVRKP